MNFQKAWDLYQKHYSPINVLGYIPALKKTRKVTNLLEIADEFDALLLDGFGVLNIGTTVIPDMPRILTTLKESGKSIFVLTNAGSLPSHITALKYPKWQYPITPDYVISSRDSLEAHLNMHPLTQNNGLWGVIGFPESQIDLLPARTLYLDKPNDDFNFVDVDGFIFLGAGCWDTERQHRLVESLIKKPRPVLVANPDLTAPLENEFTTEPGFYCLALEAIHGVTVTRFGKPFPEMYDLAYKKMNRIQQKNQLNLLNKDRILMVGDTLHTDILGGNGAGMKTALMTDHGFLRGQSAEQAIILSGITPDFIISN